MAIQDTFTKLGNPFMKALLHSPWHGLVSKSVLLITYQGIKSGRTFSTPVNYLKDGDILWTISFRRRVWWRNLRGGAPVKLYLQGQALNARAEVLEDPSMVVQAIMRYLQLAPEFGRFIGVKLDANGSPISEDVALAAQTRVMVKLVPLKS